MTSGERLTIAPKEKSQNAGLSITLTGTPAARAAAANAAASLIVGAIADGDRGAGKFGGVPSARVQYDRAMRRLGGNGEHFLGRVGRKHIDLRAGRGEQLRLPGRGCRVARDDRALAVERKEHRQARQPVHSRRWSLRRCAGHSELSTVNTGYGIIFYHLQIYLTKLTLFFLS